MGMRQSLPGLFHNTARALRHSPDDMACMMAFSLGQLVDNLRAVKDGKVTVEEFFACYVYDSKSEKSLADSVRREDYVCMQEDA